MQNQEKIIQAIAATLEENLNHAHIGYEIDCQEIAAEITAAIAPHLEAVADLPYSELFDHMANEHGLTLTNTELGDIIHVARGTGTTTGLKFKYTIGQKVWIFNGVRYQGENIKYIHIQQGVNPGDMFVRYELAFVSGWFRESEVYETKEAAIADNR